MLKIDGKNYRVHVLCPSLELSFSIAEGPNKATAQSGKEIRDVIATGYSYTMEVEPDISYPQDFDALFDAVSAPVDSHAVELPYGQSTLAFDAAISSGSIVWHGKQAGKQRWKGLSLSFRPIKPQRPAGGAW